MRGAVGIIMIINIIILQTGAEDSRKEQKGGEGSRRQQKGAEGSRREQEEQKKE